MEKKFLTYKKQFMIALGISLSLGIILLCFGFYTRNDYFKNLKSKKEEVNEQLVLYESNKNEEYLKNGLTEEYYNLNQKIETLRNQFIDINEKLSKNESNWLVNGTVIYLGSGIGLILLSFIGGIILWHFKNPFLIDKEDNYGITDEDLKEIELDINGTIEEDKIEESNE